MEREQILENVDGIVEATRREKSQLCAEYKLMGYPWVENLSGIGVTVGHLGNRPIAISLIADVVRGKKILFWEPTSVLVDHDMIDKWFDDHVDCSNTADADNFHNVF